MADEITYNNKKLSQVILCAAALDTPLKMKK